VFISLIKINLSNKKLNIGHAGPGGYVELEIYDKRIYLLCQGVCKDADVNDVMFFVNQNEVFSLQAYAEIGSKKQQTIVLTKGLVDILPHSLMKSVIAHEIGHFKLKHHDWILLEKYVTKFLSTAMVSAVFYNTYLFAAKMGIFDLQKPTEVTIKLLIDFVQVVGPLCLLSIGGSKFSEVFFLKLSRNREYSADEFSVRLYGSKVGILLHQVFAGYPISFIHQQMEFGCLPSSFFEIPLHRKTSWLSTHPRFIDRIKRMEQLDSEMRKEKSIRN